MEDLDHPWPLLRRREWQSLDGQWELALDREARWSQPSDVEFDRVVTVPFAPETPASGVGETGYCRAFWYRRRIDLGAAGGDRVLLHFNAVDHEATVWVDGREVARHSGGYTRFSADLSAFADGDEHELVVRAFDDPLDLEQPRGKQAWRPEPHGIWYPRTSGIWQTVWLERRPATAIASVHWRADVAAWSIEVDLRVDGPRRPGMRVALVLEAGGEELVRDVYLLDERGAVARTVQLPDPGIDVERARLLWSPSSPTLIRAQLTLLAADGEHLDRVESYTAMRSVRVDSRGFLLNERPLALRLVLDQGYWPDTGLTAPDVAALRRDIELVKALGFNGVRKHQKVEDPRFLRLADELGLLVWAEMPSAHRFSARSAQLVTRQWLEVLERDRSHPCVIAWVPFNESWGVPDLPVVPAQRDLVASLYHLTRAVDPTRPAIGNDGWEFVAGDFLGVHDYEQDPATLRARLAQSPEDIVVAGRRLLLDGVSAQALPLLLTELGGIALSSDDGHGTWGYDRATDGPDLLRRYARLMKVVHDATQLAGFCYTQLTDTYQEANGLLRTDRTPKVPLEALAEHTRR